MAKQHRKARNEPSAERATNSVGTTRKRRRGVEPEAAFGESPRRKIVNAIGPTETPRRSSFLSDRISTTPRDVNSAEDDQKAARRSKAREIPDEVKHRFVNSGNVYYFSDGARAFVDRGERLTTRSENTEVIKSLAAIARARGWEDITISGTQRFKQEMWLTARVAGLEVRGYTPNSFDEKRLVRALAREAKSAAPGRSNSLPLAEASPEVGGASQPAPDREQRSRQWTGRLIDHGAAPYQHKPNEPLSYFVKLETRQGEKEIWGVDLHRAMRDALSRPERGDVVVLRNVRQEPVTVTAVERDDDGRVVKEGPLNTHRNGWIVEKRDFLKGRAEVANVVRDARIDAKKATAMHPELLGTYLQLQAAEVAARKISNPDDQRKFVGIVREGLADSIARGDPLKAVRVRDSSPTRKPVASRDRPERESEHVRG